MRIPIAKDDEATAIPRIHGAKLVIGDDRPSPIVALEFGR